MMDKLTCSMQCVYDTVCTYIRRPYVGAHLLRLVPRLEECVGVADRLALGKLLLELVGHREWVFHVDDVSHGSLLYPSSSTSLVPPSSGLQ